jgi:capsular exopolysaccharide synthesis family protein
MSPFSGSGDQGQGNPIVVAGGTGELPMAATPAAFSSFDPFADGGAPGAAGARLARTSMALSPAAFLRFKWTILLIAAALAGTIIPAIWLLIVPEYAAKATIEILPSHPRVLYRTEDNSIPYHTQYFNSQPSLIRGVALLRRVLDRPEVQQTAWYQEVHKTLLGRSMSRLESLREAVLAEPRPGTYLIDISMRARDRHDGEVIINNLVDEYLAFAREKSQEADDAVYQRLVESKQSLESDIEQRKAATAELQRELGAATSADVVPRGKAWLEDRQAKLDELRREITTAEWQEQELTKLLQPAAEPAGDSTSQPVLAVLPRYEDDPEWRRLHIELKTVQHEIESNPRQLGQAHPDMIALVNKAEFAEELLKEQQARLDEQWRVYGGKPPAGPSAASTPESELAALRRKIGVLRKQEELLVEDIRQRESNYERTFDAAKTLDKENDALRYETEKFDLVRRRIDEKDTEGGMFFATRLVASAFAPSGPDHDRRSLLTIAALLGALGAGLGVGYLRICTSSRVHATADLAPAGPAAPFLGKLLLLRRPDRPDPSELAIQNECIRMVRTALLERLNGSARAVLVTSAGPGAGKTTVACLLAKSLAQLDKKVLLVEADWRNPSACRTLGASAKSGLIDILRLGNGAARAREEDAIVATSDPRLSVLPAGQAQTVRDAELLASPDFADCLERWRQRFDVVLLDGPPVLPVADARIIARQVDGTILVVREEHCRRSEIVDALASLSMSGAKMLGTLFIGSVRSVGYRRTYYDYVLPVVEPERTMDARAV